MFAPVLLVVLASASVGDLFVDASASCGGATGTASAPFCTITEAIGAGSPGDVIRIAPGTYAENLVIPASLSLVGTGGAEVTIVDGQASGSVVEVLQGTDVELIGLTLQNGLGAGAGVRNAGTLLLRNSTVRDNHADAAPGGGGIYQTNGSGPLTIIGSLIQNNVLMADYANDRASGGAIHASGGGRITVDSSTIDGNLAGWAAAIDAKQTALVLRNSTISGHDGPGNPSYAPYYTVRSWGADLHVVNTTISGNLGMGLSSLGSVPASRYIYNSTITNNRQIYGAAGLVATSAAGVSHLRIRNTIVAGNPANYRDVAGSFDTRGHNLIGRMQSGVNIVNGVNGDITSVTNPGLLPLADNGGATASHLPGPGSQAVDGGDPTNFEPLDQRGLSRIAGFTDIGAVERELGGAAIACVPVPNSTGQPSTTLATGTALAGSNAFRLEMGPLPQNSTGFFLVSPSIFNSGNPVSGSVGFFCLGSVGRIIGPGQVQSSGTEGRIRVDLNLARVPTPTGFVTVQAGQTLSFQGWHRDTVPPLGATSNFSSAHTVQFE